MKTLTDEVRDPALAVFLADIQAVCAKHGGSINGAFTAWVPTTEVTSLGLEEIEEIAGSGVTLWSKSRGEVVEDADGHVTKKE